MNRFRLLRADEIECRVAQISKTGKGLSLLLYKTARTDANLLDETVGDLYWENDFKLVDGVLYGGIGVDYQKNGHLVWKWDAGVESNTEAEKGRASDAFKRAGFKHGIGRELYTAPFIWVPSDKCNISKVEFKGQEKWVCNDSFYVEKIEYSDKQEVSFVSIVNAKTHEIAFCWRLGEKVNVPETKPKTQQKPAEPRESKDNGFVPLCADCGVKIDDRVHDYSVKRWGRPLCRDCQKKA